MKKQDYSPIITAMLKDNEFLAGGIFSKEKFYMKKYNLSIEEISEIQAHVYFALNIQNYRNRLAEYK